MYSLANFVDKFFIRYYLIVYFLYMMSLKTIIPAGGIVTVIVNGIIVLFLFLATIVRNRYNYQFIYLYSYIIFLFLLVILQSSNHSASFINLTKYLISLLSLPVGFNVFSSVAKFKEFQKTGLILLFLFILNIIFANLFNWGSSLGYGSEGALQTGNIFTDGLYVVVFTLTSLFLGLRIFPNNRKILLSLYVIGALLIFAIMKRMAIIGLLLSLFTYLFHFNFKNGITNTISIYQNKYLGYFLLLSLILLPFFYSYIINNYNQRELYFKKASDNIASETRVQELIAIKEDIFHSSNNLKFLFGKETFNLVGTYANGAYGDRPIHSDISVFLNGTGVVGLMFTLYIYLYTLFKLMYIKKKVQLRETPISAMLFSLAVSFFAFRVFTLFSGASFSVISSSYFFASIGGIMRYFYNRSLIHRSISSC